MNKKIIVCLSWFMMHLQGAEQNQLGVVTVPVAHLVGQPLGNDRAYQELPFCGGTINPYISCPRMHQLLLHETVEIIKSEGDELFIEVPHTFYITENTKLPQTRYWTSKKNIASFEELKKRNLDINLIPERIHYTKPYSVAQNNCIVTLLKPFKDQETNQIYSAGTRFVIEKEDTDNNSIKVHAFDGHNNSFRSLKVPICFFIKSVPNESAEEKIKKFVSILKEWAHPIKGSIPYVWGGCSYAHIESSHRVREYKQPKNGSIHSWYIRQKPHEENLLLKAGFDCAGLINRAAQMAGIPFFYKNTITIAEHLKEIPQNESLQPGDIIWIRGHVMVVADTKHNTIIEARGYDGGYGHVHEIAIGKVFKGINSFADLKQAWLEKQPLIRLNKAGKIQDSFKTVKLLSMKSVF